MNTNRNSGRSEHKREGSLYANKSLTHALGLRSDDRPNWSCCHLWGIDDAFYQQTNAVVQDRRYYSCIANMVLLPTPLKAFTDTMPEVKAMLRICAKQLYGWYCDDESVATSVVAIEQWSDWSAYPGSWPRPGSNNKPLGVARLDENIKRSAERRLERIRTDLRNAGPHYPREEVLATLDFWKIHIKTA